MEIDFLVDSIKNINLLDFFFLIILVYSVFQCFLKGFSLSLISFMKWVLSTVVTIILVPKFQPLVAEYIESQFINNVGLGALIFIFTLSHVQLYDYITLPTLCYFQENIFHSKSSPHWGSNNMN